MKLIASLVNAVLLALPPCHTAAEETWLAVGYGGRRMVSTDGANWQITAEWAQPGGDDSNNLMSAVFAQGKFAVVGGGGGGSTGGGHILVSTNGREWKETHAAKARINPIAFGNDRFVIGTSSYPSGKLMWSKDAETWHQGAAIQTKGLTHFRGGAFGNGLFVLVGNAGGSGGKSWAITAADGEKIVTERDDLPGHGTIVFGNGKFLMLTSHQKADIIASKDGAEWQKVTVAGDATFSWLVSTEAGFIAGNNQAAYQSKDGNAWTKLELKARGDVKWSDGHRFITSSWPGKMAFSPDGKEWQNAPQLPANGINRVIFGDVKK